MEAAAKKPRLSKQAKKDRLKWCQQFKLWTAKQWSKVIFSDEVNVEVDNRKGRLMIRRLPSEKYHPDCLQQRTRQGSGSTGIWACMGGQGFGLWKLFKERLNQWNYAEILGDYLLPSIVLLTENDDYNFQQDNAPCHKSISTERWFKDNGKWNKCA